MTDLATRHSKNPFVENLMIPIGGKNISINTLGKDNNVLVNQNTGEITGTHVVARKRVDKESFVKVFANHMSYTFDLTKAGNKALRVVMWLMQRSSIDKDTVRLDKYGLEEFLEYYETEDLALSLPTFKRGIQELEKAKIIAKTKRLSVYYINPSCIFNGDRIAFTTLIESE